MGQADWVQAVAALQRLGGVGGTREIVALSSRRKLREAVRRGEIEQRGRGRYCLATAAQHRHRAIELAGVTSHLSAAAHWGWKVAWPADRAWVTVRRKRTVDERTRSALHVVYADLRPDEVRHGVTSPLRTVIDCAKRLPFGEALAVADSALRAGDVSSEDLRVAAEALRGRGAPEARRVAEHATARAANPFESMLRALVLEFPQLTCRPQLAVRARGVTYHPDLVDSAQRLVIEADSFEFHTGREAHGRDCVRYTALTITGWTVLRFTWEQVMLSPAYVRSVLADLVDALARHAAA